MSECYVCGGKFGRTPELSMSIPICGECKPKPQEKKAIAKISEEGLFTKPQPRRFHTKYVRAGDSLPSHERVMDEQELRSLLWQGHTADLSKPGNGPHADLPGNIFWQEVTDDPQAVAKHMLWSLKSLLVGGGWKQGL